jgi:hypothetical protein
MAKMFIPYMGKLDGSAFVPCSDIKLKTKKRLNRKAWLFYKNKPLGRLSRAMFVSAIEYDLAILEQPLRIKMNKLVLDTLLDGYIIGR